MKEMKKIYREFLKKHFSQSPQVYYERAEMWLKRLPNNPDKITADYVIDFIDGYAPPTQKQYLIFFRKLFNHLGRFKEIKHIKGKKIKPTISVDDLYTKEELEAILSACNRPQDRAMVEVLYESACREGEVSSMTIENLKWLKNGVVGAIVTGKTGSRVVYLYESVPALRQWINQHPTKKDALWVSHKKPFNPIHTKTIYFRIQTLIDRANITGKKRLVHLFRHTRLTELAKDLTESELSLMAGWSTTDMAKVYVHLSQRDIEDAMLSKVFGVEPEDEDDTIIQQILTAKECPSCRARNPSTNVRCEVCNTKLIQDDIDEVIDEKIASKLLEIASAGLEKQIETYLAKQKKNEE